FGDGRGNARAGMCLFPGVFQGVRDYSGKLAGRGDREMAAGIARNIGQGGGLRGLRRSRVIRDQKRTPAVR
ncbi:MAG: hypothetical protein QGD91_13095, partial [Actinomycetota bacterium]|nr:hypothetical protein [Actinomycetota bacterium]